MRANILFVLIATISVTAFSQDKQINNEKAQSFSYAYISVEGKIFSKKLKVEVDFGDTPEQIKVGQEFTEILTNKKSYAAILNYMVEKQFELVETLELISSNQGTGGTSGIIFILKKRI